MALFTANLRSFCFFFVTVAAFILKFVGFEIVLIYISYIKSLPSQSQAKQSLSKKKNTHFPPPSSFRKTHKIQTPPKREAQNKTNCLLLLPQSPIINPPPLTHHIFFAIPLLIQSLIAIFVTIGLTPLADGKTLASATYNPSTPHTFPVESTTPSFSSADMRHVPI